MTRRRLVRNAGAMALGATVATAFPTRARSEIVTPLYGACAGSPGCNPERCTSNGCNNGRGDTKWRIYNSSTCEPGGGGDKNCWITPCDGAGQRWKCCDCCVNVAGGAAECSGCGGGAWHRCHCGLIVALC